MNKIEIQKFILTELSNFCFNKYTKGFKYLVESIYLCIENNDLIDNLNKYIFPIVAKNYNEKSPQNVKWCINQVIKTMCCNTKIDILSNYFGTNENKTPSLKLIIYTLICKYHWTYSSK